MNTELSPLAREKLARIGDLSRRFIATGKGKNKTVKQTRLFALQILQGRHKL